MKLTEIIESVDLLVPNSIPITEKVKWMNQIQSQLYRDYPFDDGIHRVNLLVGLSFYPLPANCEEQRTYSFVVENREVTYIPFFEQSTVGESEQFWTIVHGDLFVNPVPAAPQTGYLYYKKSPTHLTAEDLETVPDLPVDFHELYVYGCCARVALTSEKTLPFAEVYESKFLRLAEKADLVLAKKRQTSVSIVRSYM